MRLVLEPTQWADGAPWPGCAACCVVPLAAGNVSAASDCIKLLLVVRSGRLSSAMRTCASGRTAECCCRRRSAALLALPFCLCPCRSTIPKTVGQPARARRARRGARVATVTPCLHPAPLQPQSVKSRKVSSGRPSSEEGLDRWPPRGSATLSSGPLTARDASTARSDRQQAGKSGPRPAYCDPEASGSFSPQPGLHSPEAACGNEGKCGGLGGWVSPCCGEEGREWVWAAGSCAQPLFPPAGSDRGPRGGVGVKGRSRRSLQRPDAAFRLSGASRLTRTGRDVPGYSSACFENLQTADLPQPVLFPLLLSWDSGSSRRHPRPEPCSGSSAAARAPPLPPCRGHKEGGPPPLHSIHHPPLPHLEPKIQGLPLPATLTKKRSATVLIYTHTHPTFHCAHTQLRSALPCGSPNRPLRLSHPDGNAPQWGGWEGACDAAGGLRRRGAAGAGGRRGRGRATDLLHVADAGDQPHLHGRQPHHC